jgi:alpha-glucosidase
MGREEFSLKYAQGKGQAYPVIIGFALLILVISTITTSQPVYSDGNGTSNSLQDSLEGPQINRTHSLVSPDGSLKISVWTQVIGNESGCPVYNVSYRGNEILGRSRLGLVISNSGNALHSNLSIDSVERNSINSSIKLVSSDIDEIPDIFNQMKIRFKGRNDSSICMNILFRAYNEGISFSYEVRELGKKSSLSVVDEKTDFNISRDEFCYAEYGVEESYKKVKISKIKTKCELPLLIETDDVWITLNEANLHDYSRAYAGPGESDSGPIEISLHGDVIKNIPFRTPWRMILVGESASDMLEMGRICYSMCPENAIGDTSWIKPGKAFRDCSLTTKGSKEIIDYCLVHGIEYLHLDAGWYGKETSSGSDASTVSVKDLNLTDVISYGNKNGIGVILYVNHKALKKQYKEIFPLYQKWGIAGVKFGFIDGRTQSGINFIHDAVAEAARNRLIVNIHDNYRPTGMSRTYPNLLTQEGVRGNEQFPSARDNTILPFTRCVAGPADYTPIFATKKTTTTMAHQLALPIVIYSPLQYIYWYGTPKKAGNSSVNTLWDNLPSVWNETIFLDGSPGSHASVARRYGDDWYVGCINGPESRVLSLKLDFLDDDTYYRARMFSDPGNGTVKVIDYNVSSQTEILESIPCRSGFSIKITGNDGGDDIHYQPRLNDVGKWRLKEDTPDRMMLYTTNGWNNLSIEFRSLPDFLRISDDDLYLEAFPENEDVGNFCMDVTLKSTSGTVDEMVLELEVANTNDPPRISLPDYYMILLGEDFFIELNAVDIDPTEDELTWEIEKGSDIFFIDHHKGILGIRSGRNECGIHEVFLKVRDGNGGSDSSKIVMMISNPNSTVFLLPSNGSLEVKEGQFFSYGFQAIRDGIEINDPTWSLRNAPNFISMEEKAGIITGTTAYRDEGKYTFEIILSVEAREIASTDFSLVVQGRNQPPCITPDTCLMEMDREQRKEFQFHVEDPDHSADLLNWSLFKAPSFIELDVEKSILIMTPSKNDVGFHEIIVNATDPEGGFDDLVIALYVRGNNSGNSIIEFNGSRVKVIPINLSSEIRDLEPRTDYDGRIFTIYYPNQNESPVNDHRTVDGEVILFMFSIFAILTVLILIFMRRKGVLR